MNIWLAIWSIYNYYILAFIGIMFMITLINIIYYHKPKIKKDQKWPKLSVLIPARNEEKDISRCLDSIIAQDYPDLEILVLDDQSTDQTLKIIEEKAAKDSRIKILHGNELPEGWTGKNHACHNLAQEASGEWFLFTDADTYHYPGSFKSAVNEIIHKNLDFITMLPRTSTKSFGCKLFLDLWNLFFVAIFSPYLFRSKNENMAFGIGPFLLLKRNTYFECGGHEAIKQEIVDDVELARLVKRNGYKIGSINGNHMMDVKFYDNFQEFWQGFTKNIYDAIGKTIWTVIPILFFIAFPLLIPYVSSITNLFIDPVSHLAIISYCQVGILTLIWLLLITLFHSPFYMIVEFPFSVMMTIALILGSMFRRKKKKGVNWKDRSYNFEEKK